MYELNRMAMLDEAPKLCESQAIGLSIKWIRKHKPHIKWLLSFSDGKQGNVGIIYQATNYAWGLDYQIAFINATMRYYIQFKFGINSKKANLMLILWMKFINILTMYLNLNQDNIYIYSLFKKSNMF